MVKMVKLMNTELTPEGWESKAIGDISNIHRGMSWNADNVTDRPDMGIPVLRIPNVQNKLSLDDLKYLSDISEQDKVRYRVSQGYSIMVGSNGNKDRVGNCCYIEQDMEFVFASFLLACSAKEGNDNKYLFYLLTSYPIQGAISSDATTSTGLHNIGLKFIRKREVLIPPLPEQRKIAEILTTVDETIEKTDAIIRETQQLKKGQMQKLFTEGIGHTRFKETKIGRIPEEWEVVRFNQYLQKTKQKDPTKKPDEKFTYIDVSAVSNEFFKIVESKTILGKDAPSRARKGIKTGDTIYATVRPYLRRVAFVPSELDGEICSTGYCVLRPKSEEIFHRFVFQLMLTHRVNEYLESLQAGTSYPAISDSDVYQMLIPKPPLPEQRRIAEILSEVDAKLETEQAFKSELEQLKKGLMQVLLTGKVRVKV